MRKQMYFILMAVIFFFCLKGEIARAEETPLQVEDNWLTREVARQVGKNDVKTLTQEDFEKVTYIHIVDSKLEISDIPKEISLLSNLYNLDLIHQQIQKYLKN